MASKATNHFVMQRLTAMLQVPLVIWLTVSALGHARDDHAAFMGWIASPLPAILLIVFMLSVAYHARLGLGEVADDYVHKDGANRASQGLIQAYTALLAVIAIASVIIITLRA